MKYIVYTMSNCPDCKNAKDLLKRKGLEFTEVTEFTPQELVAEVGPVRTLPQIIEVGEGERKAHVGGYKDLVAVLAGEKLPRPLN